MGRHGPWRAGSFYRVSDRTGFPTRAEKTRKEWNGLFVEDAVWEARQPQDLVRGVVDNQTVPDARPLPPNSFVGPFYAALSKAAAIGDTVLNVQSVAGFSKGDSVGLMLDSGVVFKTTLATAPGASTVTLTAPLPNKAASGNMLADYAPQVVIDPD